ncbi:MAG TPA: tripartite tricarboxylate transporter substrate binding protein [Burkholderiales bacterium]|jgi:tripartite-type tricarboxylate transporter receptor subunit TctC
MRRILLATLLSVVAGIAHPCFGQQASYPSKPVKIVIPLGPGSSVEIVTRLVTQKLSAALGRPFVIESQPGASSQIGIEHVAKSPPDGYTLLCSNDNIVSLPSLKKNVGFDIHRDFLPITQVAGFPMVLIAHPSVPAKSVDELVALAKRQPGKLDYTSGGVGSIQHVAMELFEQATGIRLNHIPYKGAPQAMMDVVAGQAPVAFSPSPIVAAHVKAGRLRALAIGSDKRLPLLPDVPTLAEQKVPLQIVPWAGLFAPAGTPTEIVALLNREVARALKAPDVREAAAGFGFELYGNTPKEFATAIDSDLARTSKVIRDAGIKPD